MIKINKGNIGGYIAYLYNKKHGLSAPTELIEKWKNVPSSNIDFELSKLYEHWNLKTIEIINLEKTYIEQLDSLGYKYSTRVIIIFVVVYLIIILYAIYFENIH
jgi:hypothetical protein